MPAPTTPSRARRSRKPGQPWPQRPRLALLLTLACLLALAPAGHAQEGPADRPPPEATAEAATGAATETEPAPLVREWAVLAGVFDVGTGDETGQVEAEARFRKLRLPLGSLELPLEPAAGAMVTGDGAAYAHLSFRLTLKDLWRTPWPERWRVVPFLGMGLYEEGDGKDLGGPVEFRSGVEVSYRAGRRWWLGATLYHLSNAVIYDSNPGEESLLLTVSWR